jgi:hypothetical protein
MHQCIFCVNNEKENSKKIAILRGSAVLSSTQSSKMQLFDALSDIFASPIQIVVL